MRTGLIWGPSAEEQRNDAHKTFSRLPSLCFCHFLKCLQPGEFSELKVTEGAYDGSIVFWRRLLRVPWKARRLNQSILKAINPEYSFEGLVLQCWNSNTLATWWEELTHWKKTWSRKDWGQEEKGTTEDEMVGWHHWLSGCEFSLMKDQEACCAAVHGVAKRWTWLIDWTTTADRFLIRVSIKKKSKALSHTSSFPRLSLPRAPLSLCSDPQMTHSPSHSSVGSKYPFTPELLQRAETCSLGAFAWEAFAFGFKQ